MAKHFVGVLMVFLCLLGFRPSTSVCYSQPLTTAPKQAVDEELFLVRNIEHVLRTWRGPETPADELQPWLAATRTSLSQLRKTAEFDKLDDRVVNAYSDLLDLLDDYEEFLARSDLVTFISDLRQNEQPQENEAVSEVVIELESTFESCMTNNLWMRRSDDPPARQFRGIFS